MSETEDTNILEVLLNELILENIFSHFNLPSLLPFRLVCKTWECVLTPFIATNKKARITFIDVEGPDNSNNLKLIKKFKISRVNIKFPGWQDFQRNEELVPKLLNFVKEIGHQLKYIVFEDCYLGKDTEWQRLRIVLSFSPNLKVLKLHFYNNFSLSPKMFQDFCHPALRSLSSTNSPSISEMGNEDFFLQIHKSFPNLESNFRKENFDFHFLSDSAREKGTLEKIKHWKYSPCKGDYIPLTFNLFQETSINLTTLELDQCREWDQGKVDQLMLCLQNASTTLVSLKIMFSFHELGQREEMVINIPPLPKLRKMCLGMSRLQGWTNLDDRNLPYFSWNLGKKIATSFPLLEHFELVPYNDIKRKHFGNVFDENYPIEKSWKLWEPFVPLDKAGVEYAPLKSLKLVDLGIPKDWVGQDENVEWGKQFLQFYLKVYGNGGRDKIQHIVEWIDDVSANSRNRE